MYRWILVLLAKYDCEIPAFAGMVLWGNGELLADLALLSPPLSPGGYRPGDSCFRRNGLVGDGSVSADFGIIGDT